MILIIIISNSFKEEVLLAIIMAQAVESNDKCYFDMLPLEILEIIFMYLLTWLLQTTYAGLLNMHYR